MDSETQKIITKQFQKLPEDVQMSIVSSEYNTKLREISQRQKLLIDQAGKLEMETTLVMIGLEPLADYVANLQRELVVPIMRAKEIASDVSENIFKPIRDSLRAMNQEMAVESDAEVRIEAANIANASKGVAEPKVQTPNEKPLDREQILSEIEDPSTIREIETLDEIPYQQDIKIKNVPKTESTPKINIENTVPENIVPKSSLLETKMAGMTITTQQIVEAVPENKLPPVIEKKRPSSGVDPYREAIS